jgi:hypothetical protein
MLMKAAGKDCTALFSILLLFIIFALLLKISCCLLRTHIGTQFYHASWCGYQRHGLHTAMCVHMISTTLLQPYLHLFVIDLLMIVIINNLIIVIVDCVAVYNS